MENNSISLGLLESDLIQIATENQDVLRQLNGKNILVLGGTGFVGSWLAKSLSYFINNGGTTHLAIASRNASRSEVFYKELSKKPEFIDLDISADSVQELNDFDVVINCATPSTAAGGTNDVSKLYKTIVDGTERLVTDMTATEKQIRLVNLSSGAVTCLLQEESCGYIKNCPVEHIGTPAGAYSHGKRIAEELVQEKTAEGYLSGINLRLYAFAGPGIPLDQHFAAGNFMQNAKNGSPIEIKGNPETVRSYQYPTDLMRSILLAAAGTNTETLEVGSQERVTMSELAASISKLTSQVPVSSGNKLMPISKYFPSLQTICESKVNLEESITRWWKWIKLTAN
jgi:nucleoside-diphosphate-sugar epimerase